MSKQTEIERKFAIVAGQDVPPLACAAFGPTATFTMRAVYYDTPAYALTRSQAATLRRREGGADQGWHLKLRRSGDERLEVHAPLVHTLVPSELREAIVDLVGLEPLIPVAVLTTLRAETDLVDAQQVVLGKLCRDEVTAEVGGRTQRWVEVEVETVAGDVAWLDAVTAEFSAAGIEPAEVASKLGRAMADVVAEQAPEPTAGSIVMDYLATQVGVLQARSVDVRADAPDAVHRSRVATRRLRSALRTFAPLFTSVQGLRSELKWHAEELGAPRDAEVLLERLLAVVDRLPAAALSGPVRERLTATLEATHAEAHADLVHSMDKSRYVELQLALQQLLVDPPLTKRADSAPEDALPRLVRKTSKRVAAAAAHAAAEPEVLAGWHEVRKLAKAARYSHEAVSGHFGEPAKAVAANWEEVTEAFGQLQDTLVARERVREVAHDAVRAGEPGDPYGLIIDLEIRDGVTALVRGREALAAALEAPPLQ